MKLGERKYTQDEGPAQEPWTEAPGKSPRAADGKTGILLPWQETWKMR